ncbi:peroxisomal acyl-coenzyme A oxidase 1-like [Ylistrum balloti]|uniref:peroxisomal acyl-coenzyme A oxidase 1-like n=1 Tax=Ylistrum balloti TaxID=509963 RepID=UPI002905D6F1|nr:peroxisomal acyl-coenzyme A oxidase 1-like [Ylistrum balloti]
MASAKLLVNSDLQNDRKRATFDVEKLTNFIDGGAEKTSRRRYIQNTAVNDHAALKLKPWAFRTREENYEAVVRKQVQVARRSKELGLNNQEISIYEETFQSHESNRIGPRNGMFPPTIEKQGTTEQKKKFLPLIQNMTLLGCYAQTEMGHGTFVRGLESTATYDPKTKEFILNTPTITSMKFWPGSLGKTSNVCVFLAQLYTQGKCHGIHTFVLPLRDIDTHESLPGIEVGDIGPKFGFKENDNGYLRVNNVRIPRDYMLMRYAKVLEDGTYVKPENSKITYGTLILSRVFLCVVIFVYTDSKSASYLCLDRGPEAQVLDYQTQQTKLFPLLAKSYAFIFVARAVDQTFNRINSQIELGKLDYLAELHALCAGLKAFTTDQAAAGIEVCRMSCGGHGYSDASGLPKIYVSATAMCTVEGENSVMLLQMARFLIKSYNKMKTGHPLKGFVEYLGNKQTARSSMTKNITLQCLQEAYEHRAVRMIEEAAQSLKKHQKLGLTAEDAWNLTSTQLTWAALAHCHAYVVKMFVSMVTTIGLDDNVRAAVTSLCFLYAVDGIHEKLGEFIQDGFFDSAQVDILTNKMVTLLSEIRPNAVAMVDAFDLPDINLDSCLGRYDGNVYQALYDYAKSSPLNENDVLSSFHKYIQPLRKMSNKDGELQAKL